MKPTIDHLHAGIALLLALGAGGSSCSQPSSSSAAQLAAAQAAVGTSTSTSTNTGTYVSSNAPASCQGIGNICQAAGFAPGNWQAGSGYWRDCVNPVMQGQTGTAPGGTLALPTVSSALISQCASDANGKFGTGTVGSVAASQPSH